MLLMRSVPALLAWFCCLPCCAMLACAADAPAVSLTRVAPAAGAACGLPADGRTLLITALGDFPAGETTARAIDLADSARLDLGTFPPATRVFTLEVIGSGGALRALGKTMPFDLAALTHGDTIPVFMAPPLGACPVGPPAAARIHPLVARAGTGALIAGGVDPDGAPVLTAEHYDPATGAFETVASALYGTADLGLAGASATTLADGRVLIAGGAAPAYQIYDPATRSFSAALFLGQSRAFHAALALDGDADDEDGARILLAGGCSVLDQTGACDPAQGLTSTSIMDVDTGTVRAGPRLLLPRIGGAAVHEGADTVLLVGGFDPAGAPLRTAERVYLDGRPGHTIDGAGASAARLLAGGVLTAFAPPGAAPAADAAILLPAAAQAPASRTATALAPAPRSGATLTPLQDGRVLVLGGLADSDPPDTDAPQTAALLYEPVRNAFAPVTIAGPVLAPATGPATGPGTGPAHGAVLLDDGTVLVIGAQADGSAAAGPGAGRAAWVIRPDLLGPFASDATVTFADAALALRVVPRDPARAALVPAADDDGAHYRIESSAGSGLPSEWAVLAGPAFARARLAARVRATEGGLAVLLGFRAPGDHVALILTPGQPATLLRVAPDTVSVIEPCSAEVILASQLRGSGGPRLLEVDTGDSITATLDGTQVLACPDVAPVPAGHVGLGVIGPAGATLRVDSILVRRLAP